MTTGPSFEVTDVPPETPPFTPPTVEGTVPRAVNPSGEASSDLTCRVCGTSLAYGGRGRKPTLCDEHKRAASPSGARSPRSSGGDVAAAMAQMEIAYGLVSMALMMVSPSAAIAFGERVPATQEINRQAFESDKRLAKRIGTVSQSAAPLMFYGANAFLIVPPVRLALGELMERRRSQAEQEAANTATPFGDFTATDIPDTPNGYGHA